MSYIPIAHIYMPSALILNSLNHLKQCKLEHTPTLQTKLCIVLTYCFINPTDVA